VVQSGVSSAIRVLEHELDTILFDRDRHRVVLTDAGRVLLPEARATLAAAQAARDAIREAAAGLRREVRFEVADFVTAASLVRNGLGVAFLPESFAASVADLPAIRVVGAQLNWPVSIATAAGRPLSAAGRAFLGELMAAAPGPAHPPD
jgi:DNA-binding transcriptional LysR family regulator